MPHTVELGTQTNRSVELRLPSGESIWLGVIRAKDAYVRLHLEHREPFEVITGVTGTGIERVIHSQER